MIGVAVVNDTEVIVRGVAEMLRPYSSQFEFVDMARAKGHADIVLYDTFATTPGRAPGLACLVADPRIAKVVVYTWNFQPWLATEAIEQGAAGYLSKRLPSTQLVAALKDVHASQVVIAPTDPSNRVVAGDWPGRDDGLTARESEVLSLITMGLSNADIAQRLNLSVNSIKSYIRSCYRKIYADSRSQAVLWGVAHGLRPQPLVASEAAGAHRLVAHSSVVS